MHQSVRVIEDLLALLHEREQLLGAIPHCTCLGEPCVAHALVWLRKARLALERLEMEEPCLLP